MAPDVLQVRAFQIRDQQAFPAGDVFFEDIAGRADDNRHSRESQPIAVLTGLSDGFIGIVMVAVVTSLPELVAMVSAVRFGAHDIAVGNLFGSNVFNMFALGLADVFYTKGIFMNDIDPAFALAGLLALLMTTMGLMGNLAQVERRVGIVEIDALLLILCYFAGLWLLYIRGIGV